MPIVLAFDNTTIETDHCLAYWIVCTGNAMPRAQHLWWVFCYHGIMTDPPDAVDYSSWCPSFITMPYDMAY